MPKFNTNQILSKLVHYTDRVVGHTANKMSGTKDALKGAKSLGIKGVPESSITRAERIAKVAKGRSFQTRIKTGVGVVAGGTAGFLGIHKYQQHKDNKIMERINNMYNLQSKK